MSMIGVRNKYLLPLLIFFLLLTGSHQSTAGEKFRLPLNTNTYITSSFGEYRGDHLHNGIDFSTKGQTDLPVLAADTGTVDEVFFDPDRYGKTIILTHENGARTWYSHLSGLAGSLAEDLKSPVPPRESLDVDSTIRVSQGETIGRSGRTGRGPGHLHFTLQSDDGSFRNPIDQFSPKIAYDPEPGLFDFRVYPLDGRSWVDGRAEPVHYKTLPEDPIEVWGEIGLDVAVWNQHQNGSVRSLPYHISLRRGDEFLKEYSFDKLSEFRQDTGVRTLYNQNFSHITPTRFTLHMNKTNSNHLWEGIKFDQPGKEGTITLKLVTRTGRVESYSIPYKVVPPPSTINWENRKTDSNVQSEEVRTPNPNFKLVSLNHGQFAQEQYSPPDYEQPDNPRVNLTTEWKVNRVRIELNIENKWTGWPELRVEGNDYKKKIDLYQVEPGNFVAWWTPENNSDGWYQFKGELRTGSSVKSDTERLYVQSVEPGDPSSLVSPDGLISLFSPGESLNLKTYVTIKPVEKNSAREELNFVTSPYRIQPNLFKTLHSWELTANLSSFDRPGKIGLYKWDSTRERWRLLSFDEGLTETSRVGEIHSPGRVALLRDISPPEIGQPRRISMNEIIVPFDENGSGIDPESITVKYGGTIQDHYVEPNRPRIRVIQDSDLSPKQELSIDVSDRAGNSNRWRGTLD